MTAPAAPMPTCRQTSPSTVRFVWFPPLCWERLSLIHPLPLHAREPLQSAPTHSDAYIPSARPTCRISFSRPSSAAPTLPTHQSSCQSSSAHCPPRPWFRHQGKPPLGCTLSLPSK